MDDKLDSIPKKEEFRLLVVGPSWIVGMFPDRVIEKTELEMSAKLGVTVKTEVVAEIGKGISWMKRKLQDKLDLHKEARYDCVMIFPGRNDLKSANAGEIGKKILDVLTLAKEIPHLFLFNVQYSDERLFRGHTTKIGRINEFIAKTLEPLFPNMRVLDTYSYTKEHGLGYPLHPNGKAYAELREWALGIVTKEIKRTVKKDDIDPQKLRANRVSR